MFVSYLLYIDGDLNASIQSRKPCEKLNNLQTDKGLTSKTMSQIYVIFSEL